MLKLCRKTLLSSLLMFTVCATAFAATGTSQVTGWEFLGLKNQEVRAFAIGPDRLLYAGIDSGAAGPMGVYQYDMQQGRWTLINNGLPDVAEVTALATYNNVLYAGMNGEGVYQYDAASKQWSVTNNGLPAYLGSTGIDQLLVNNGILYAVVDTLTSGQQITQVYSYNANTKTWIVTPNSTSLSDLVSNNNTLYASNGANVYQYDPRQNQWIIFIPASVPQIVSIIFYNGVVYASTIGNGVYQYDATSQAWLPINAGLDLNYMFGAFGIYNGTLYVGGEGGDIGDSGVVYQYNATTKTWTNNTPPSIQTASPLAFIVYNGALYTGMSEDSDNTSGGVFRFTN